MPIPRGARVLNMLVQQACAPGPLLAWHDFDQVTQSKTAVDSRWTYKRCHLETAQHHILVAADRSKRMISSCVKHIKASPADHKMCAPFLPKTKIRPKK